MFIIFLIIFFFLFKNVIPLVKYKEKNKKTKLLCIYIKNLFIKKILTLYQSLQIEKI